ncbi:MAG: histidinol dehydrogenase [Pseudomonadota bacterium]
MIRTLTYSQVDFQSQLDKLLVRQDYSAEANQIQQQVADIIARVVADGDDALIELTKKFDEHELSAAELEIPQSRLKTALDTIPAEQRSALEYACERVRKYHEHQLEKSWHYEESDGSQFGQKITPLAKAGLYVPGGKATYPSSVIMNAIPAKVAGVDELVMVTPTPKGNYNDMVLAAASLAGVDRVFRIGGAHAIAALAYGTETIPRVDKITGPGNIYVATAKQQVFGRVGIDMLAGPSEVLVIADETANPEWVAMDLFAQAEHDELAQAILLTTSESFAKDVYSAIEKLLPQMERQAIIADALQDHGALIIAGSSAQIVDIADQIAAEHLQIFTEDADDLSQKIRHAGAMFIGQFSAESLGDYCAGPSHVLPTSGTARFSSPLGVYDFQKRTSILKVSQTGADQIGQRASVLARGESLTAHARSAEYRLHKNNG